MMPLDYRYYWRQAFTGITGLPSDGEMPSPEQLRAAEEEHPGTALAIARFASQLQDRAYEQNREEMESRQASLTIQIRVAQAIAVLLFLAHLVGLGIAVWWM